MVPPIWSFSLVAVDVEEGSCVEVGVALDGVEGVFDFEDAEDVLSDFEVNPAPRPTASPTTSSTATRMTQNTVRFNPQIRAFLVGFWGSGSDQSRGTSGV
jgi:hypothetical protein